MAEPEASSRIFISYRREDSSGHVLALLPALRRHFGADRIFKDTDNIPPGADFLKFIKSELESCSVLLAIIGREWLTIQDARLKRRRLDNPDDFLRVEVASALKNDRIRVIPVLIERATMPAVEDLPPDLADLPFRNAIELSDIRWESDVQLLIQAVERAADSAAKPKAAARPGLADLEKRRAREIAVHLSAASEAFETGDFERTLWACDKALLLDPQRADVLELMDRARKALDEQKIEGWLNEARQAMSQGDIGKASDLIDQALSVDQASQPALALRNDMLELRRDRERERERARVVRAAIDRAKASFEDEDFDSAVRHADDALAVESGVVDALDIRSKALAVLEERRRLREHKRRAQQTITEARAKFMAGEHDEALRMLRDFSPAHEVASQALVELEKELQAIEQRQQQAAAEEARQKELRRAQAEAERAAAERAVAEQHEREERERRQREEAERQKREKAERRQKEEAERQKEEEAERQKKKEAEQRQRQEGERRQREEAERRQREEMQRRQEEEKVRRQKEDDARLAPKAAAAPRTPVAKDENVQFTVFRRSTIRPEQWYPLLVFAHLSERRPDAPPDEPDPIAEVQAQARQVLGEAIADFRAATEDSGYAVAREGELRFVPHMEGVTFNPPERRLLWTESVHREDFRMRADASLHGRVARGAVSVFNGNLLLAEVQVSIKVNRDAADATQEESHARPYRRIFASYSHRDTAIVEEFESHAAATGDRYLRDVVSLRAGEVWDQRLLEMIKQADVFQLFWSWNALTSPLVREEWRQALALDRPHFIRPVYWEEPLPEQAGLPPAELRRLHFQRVYPSTAPPKPAVAPAPPLPAEAAPLPQAPRRPITRLISYGSAAAFVVAVGLYSFLQTSPADRPSTTPSVGTGVTETLPPTSPNPQIVPAPTEVDPPTRGAAEPPPSATTQPTATASKPAPPTAVETPARGGGRRGAQPGRQGASNPATAKPVEVPSAPVDRPPVTTPPVEAPAPSPAPPPVVTKKDEPADTAPPAVSAKPPAPEPARPAVIDRVAEEGRVKDALAQYERGHDNLDAAAVSSVFPGAPSNLAKTFAEYEFYRLEIIIEKISLGPDATTATAICRLSHFFQPKVGRSRQSVRRQEFSLQKRGNSWIIVGIR